MDKIATIESGFLAAYSGSTVTGYKSDLSGWYAYCKTNKIKVLEAKRLQIEMFSRQMEADGYARATIARRISTISGFYTYCESEEIITQSPARFVRRLRISPESSTLGLDRMELGGFLATSIAVGKTQHALSCLLALNGLRVSEACEANIEDLGSQRGHRTLRIMGKGQKPAIFPMAPRTARAVDLSAGDRPDGPILLHNKERLDRFSAGRMVRAVAKKSGVTKKIGPHSLRHSFITAALDAGVPLRDVQIAARHSDPRTTVRYDRNRMDLDRHAAYVVCAFVAGGA